MSEETLEELKQQLATMQSQLTDQSSELDRLRGHNTKLLGEKKSVQEQLKAFEGIGDPELAAKLIAQVKNDEDLKAFAEGKGPEVLARHTDRLTSEFQTKIEELTNELTSSKKDAGKFEKLYHESEAGHAIREAAVTAGVRDEAVSDILLRTRGMFTVAEDGTLEARDSEGNLRKVGNKVMTPELLIESYREKHPHYWPDSKGTGARGAGGSQIPNPFLKGANFSVTEQAKLRKTNPEMATRFEQEAKAAS